MDYNTTAVNSISNMYPTAYLYKQSNIENTNKYLLTTLWYNVAIE